MKKILLSIGTMTSIIAPVVAVVSCGDEAKTNKPTLPSEVSNFAKQELHRLLAIDTSKVASVSADLDYPVTSTNTDGTINDLGTVPILMKINFANGATINGHPSGQWLSMYGTKYDGAPEVEIRDIQLSSDLVEIPFMGVKEKLSLSPAQVENLEHLLQSVYRKLIAK